MRRFLLPLVALFSVVASAPALAQKLPDGPVTMIVPFPAGGGTDAFARALADDLRVALKRPIVITNFGGGGGTLGMSRLATAKPDGLTIGIGSTSNLANVPVLKPESTPYKPLRDFIPIGQFTAVSQVIAVNKEKLPGVDSMAKLIDYMKKNPGKISYGTPGVGTGQHMAGELLQQMTGTRMLHVPYSGSNKVIPDLLGGQIDAAIDTATVLQPQIKTGKLLLLAWTGRTRPEFDKTMPTVAETVPGYERIGGHGLLVPAKTPQEIVDLYAHALQAFAAKPETAIMFRDLGVQGVISTPTQYAEDIRKELERIGSIVKNSSSKFE